MVDALNEVQRSGNAFVVPAKRDAVLFEGDKDRLPRKKNKREEEGKWGKQDKDFIQIT